MLDNQIQIGENIIDIQPIKMKYMKNNFYGFYALLQKYKINIFDYQDGVIIFQKFLASIFDNNIEMISYIIENFEEKVFLELLNKVKIINELDDEIQKEDEKEQENKDKKKIDGLTIRRGYAMLGVYCGLSEAIIDECTYLYYKDCINELAIKFNWEITKHMLSQPVESEDGVKARQESISSSYPFSVNMDKNKKDDKTIPEGNTLEGLKRLGIDIQVAKAKDFVPISEMFKQNQEQLSVDKENNENEK